MHGAEDLCLGIPFKYSLLSPLHPTCQARQHGTCPHLLQLKMNAARKPASSCQGSSAKRGLDERVQVSDSQPGYIYPQEYVPEPLGIRGKK